MARPRVAHQLEDLLHLFHMQALAHIDDVDGLIQVIFVELHDRQGQFLGGIQRGTIRSQDHRYTVFFFCAQKGVEVYNDRIFRSSIGGKPAFNQLVHQHFTGIFHIAFEINAVEMFAKQFVNLGKAVHRPLPGLQPQIMDVFLASIPTGKVCPDSLLETFLLMETAVSFGIEVRHPAHLIRAGFFSIMIHFVVAHPLDHMQPDIADVISSDDLFSARFENIADRTAQDHIA